jgi:ribosomal protein S18 acetylase RimI-like enzyme
MDEGLEVVRGIEERHLHAAAEILYHGFEHKLRPTLGGKRRALASVRGALVGARMLGALRDGELVGVGVLIGPSDNRTSFATRTALHRYLGFWTGLHRLAMSMAALGRPQALELFIDALAVRADQRGRGVGTALLRGAFDLAGELGVERLRLQVVDTNPRAKALYERMGFHAAAAHRVPLVGSIMGFSAYTDMVRPVAEPAG